MENDNESIIEKILSNKLPMMSESVQDSEIVNKKVQAYPNYSTSNSKILIHDFEGNLLKICPQGVSEAGHWYYRNKFSGKFWDGKVRFSVEN